MNDQNLELLGELRSEAGVRTFRARDAASDSPLIVKIIESPLLGSGDVGRRVHARVKRWQALDHAGLLRPLHFEQEGQKLLVVLPEIRTGSLEDRLRMGAVSSLDLGDLSSEVTRALQTLHESGMAHGNLKPSNLLFDEEGRVLLTDLHLGVRPTNADGRDSLAGSGYQAPELQAGGNPTPAADQYSWALTLLTLITRRGPDGALQYLADRSDNPPSGAFHRQGGEMLSRRVAEEFRRALAQDPAQRFGSMSEFNQALQVALGYKAAPERRPEPQRKKQKPAPPPQRRRSPLRMVALILLPLLCIVGAVPAFSSEWGGSLLQELQGLSPGTELQVSEGTIEDPVAGSDQQDQAALSEPTASGQESAPTAVVQESGANQNVASDDPTEDQTGKTGENQEQAEPTEGSALAGPGPPPDDPSPTNAPSPTTGPTDTPAVVPTATPTPPPTSAPTNTPQPTDTPGQDTNPNACKSDRDHPRYCTPTPGT